MEPIVLTDPNVTPTTASLFERIGENTEALDNALRSSLSASHRYLRSIEILQRRQMLALQVHQKNQNRQWHRYRGKQPNRCRKRDQTDGAENKDQIKYLILSCLLPITDTSLLPKSGSNCLFLANCNKFDTI